MKKLLLILLVVATLGTFLFYGSSATANPSPADLIMKNPTMQQTHTVVWEPNSTGLTTVSCPGESLALGGGFSSESEKVRVSISSPSFNGVNEVTGDLYVSQTWVVQGKNLSNQPVRVRAWVVCADAGVR